MLQCVTMSEQIGAGRVRIWIDIEKYALILCISTTEAQAMLIQTRTIYGTQYHVTLADSTQFANVYRTADEK